MIPDKLYISQLIYGTWQYQTPDPDDETQVEYIRKDALMEMLLTMEARHSVFYLEGKIVREVIDKINSL